jgi:GDPmannose 4,6-dehydratase
MNAIIFGANGQDGYYLSLLLKEKGYKVIAISRNENFLQVNLASYNEVSDCIRKFKPLVIFHLAANSTTRHDALFENHETISTGTLNILDAVKNVSPETKVFLSGSGLQFANNNQPIKETDPFAARDAYSVCRIQSVYAARYYRSIGIKAFVGFFFNHDSPKRTERHIAKKITETVKRIKAGSSEKVEIGDMSVIKEWTFAGDVTQGIMQLVNQDGVYEANIGSGLGYSIEEWIKTCFEIIGKDYRDHIRIIPGFKPEYKMLVSDSSLIQSLGFKPRVSFRQLAEMMVNDT